LVQETSVAQSTLQWREKDSDGYVMWNHGVQIELDHVMSRAGTRRQLTLTYDSERVHILEPVSTGLFSEQYANEDSWSLVQLLRELNLAVSRQCAARRNRGEEAMSQVRESIYRRVIGTGNSELGQLAPK
ncbi:MAG TPA: hypothetical protein VFB63_23150, partial [Bryobacteraceae bacterium]|nr:hypothetical protein [Bryobacteraceae bacterium]